MAAHRNQRPQLLTSCWMEIHGPWAENPSGEEKLPWNLGGGPEEIRVTGETWATYNTRLNWRGIGEDASGTEQGDASGFSGRSWRCEWLLIRKASGGKELV